MAGVDRDAAVQRLVALASGRGFALAFDLLGTRAEAEDAVQDALVRAIGGLARLRDPDALDGWFYRVLTNGCLRVLRRRRIVGAFARLVGARGDVGYFPAQLAPDHAKLLAAGQPKAKVVMVPGMTHILKDVASDDRAANLATLTDPSLPASAGLVDAVADFVRR